MCSMHGEPELKRPVSKPMHRLEGNVNDIC
jgi:hypothetical protein